MRGALTSAVLPFLADVIAYQSHGRRAEVHGRVRQVIDKELGVEYGTASKPLTVIAHSLGGGAPGADDDPRTAGATFMLRNPSTGESQSFALPAQNWKGLGNPAGSKGYLYKDRKQEAGACIKVLLKEGKLRAICKGDGISFDLDAGMGDSSCVSCGECVAACPTAALQPAVFEAGLEGLWTPILVPRLGYCDYSCSACGQVCPVEAIPALALEEKRTQVVGEAYINTNRCIAWSDHQDCIVCEEMCPVPDKAIYLEEATVILRGGETKRIQLPYMIRELCIGCGICEYKCPINGEAAIRVYVPSDNVLSF